MLNKYAYIALAVASLFFGGIGLHKFYEGKIGWGIVYILFCFTGIPWIATLFELIIAIFEPCDENGMFINRRRYY